MFTSDHCPFCQAWEREVGKIYDQSPYGQQLPLTRHEFGSTVSDSLQLTAPVLGTPTFVVLDSDVEVGRIEGYSGADMFWWQLSAFSSD